MFNTRTLIMNTYQGSETSTSKGVEEMANSVKKTTKKTSTNKKSSTGGNGVTVPKKSENGNNLVWVPVKGGTKYHSNPNCSGMDNPIQVTLETAKKNNYSPCKKCYK